MVANIQLCQIHNDKFIVKMCENMFEEIADTNSKKHVCPGNCKDTETMETSCTGEIQINIKYGRRCDNTLDDIHEEAENADSGESSSSEYDNEGSNGKPETDDQSTDIEKSEDEINETEYDIEEDDIGDVPSGGIDYDDYNDNLTDNSSKKEVKISQKIDYFEDIKQKVLGERSPEYISLLGPESLKSGK